MRWILRSNFSHKREDLPKLGGPHASSCSDQYKQGSRICNPCLQLHRCDPIISSSFYILPLCEWKRNSCFLTIPVRSHWIILVHITFAITHHSPPSYIYPSIHLHVHWNWKTSSWLKMEVHVSDLIIGRYADVIINIIKIRYSFILPLLFHWRST